MPRTATDIDVLQEYASGAMDRAEHHAGQVNDICLAIAGAVIRRKDGRIQVYEREGQMTNALWIHVSGSRYALSYNHKDGKIDIREDSMRGDVLASFDNSNTASEVRLFFTSL